MEKVYVNLKKHKAMMSSTTWKEEKMWQAHSEKRPGLIEYVPAHKVQKYIDIVRVLSQSEKITETDLKELIILAKKTMEG